MYHLFRGEVWANFSILEPASLGQSVLCTLTPYIREQLAWTGENVSRCLGVCKHWPKTPSLLAPGGLSPALILLSALLMQVAAFSLKESLFSSAASAPFVSPCCCYFSPLDRSDTHQMYNSLCLFLCNSCDPLGVQHPQRRARGTPGLALPSSSAFVSSTTAPDV